ncbi:MAG: hypothetical protein AB7T06_11695 [Kofleriaceae bacterium]
MATLLMHSPDVPANVREALRAADRAEPADRTDQLKTAAHLLYQEVDLPCADVRELVGLPAGECGC